MIEIDKRPERTTVRVLLAPAKDGRDSASASFQALRAALAPACADGGLELVEVGSLGGAAEEIRARRFAAVVVDAPSLPAIAAALALAAGAATRDDEAPLPLVLVTPHVAELARLAGQHPQLVVDALDPALAPVLAPMKVSAWAAVHRADLALRHRLETAVRAAEEHLATVSHDLRNPLGTVLLAAQRIETSADAGPAGAVIRKSTATIARAVERMSRLVGDLLDLARLDAGQSLPLELEDVDLVEQVRQAAELIEPLATARKISVEVVASGPERAWCDSERVQQVLANLLGNAVKFTREGGAIRLAIGRDGDSVVIGVTDTGVGIAPAQLPHIFHAYWQHDVQRTRGAGLGLAIAQAIALAHGGALDVESTEGVGSTFYLRLPCRTAPEIR